jgi:hypothetical protein
MPRELVQAEIGECVMRRAIHSECCFGSLRCLTCINAKTLGFL